MSEVAPDQPTYGSIILKARRTILEARAAQDAVARVRREAATIPVERNYEEKRDEYASDILTRIMLIDFERVMTEITELAHQKVGQDPAVAIHLELGVDFEKCLKDCLIDTRNAVSESRSTETKDGVFELMHVSSADFCRKIQESAGFQELVKEAQKQELHLALQALPIDEYKSPIEGYENKRYVNAYMSSKAAVTLVLTVSAEFIEKPIQVNWPIESKYMEEHTSKIPVGHIGHVAHAKIPEARRPFAPAALAA